MKLSTFHRGRNIGPQHGFTLLELIIATIILVILTSMAVPLARVTIKRDNVSLLDGAHILRGSEARTPISDNDTAPSLRAAGVKRASTYILSP